MATNAVTLKLLADTKGIRDGINQTNQQLTGMQGSLQKTTGFVKNMVTGFLAFQGVQVATRFIGDAIGKASDLQETLSKSNTIFGDQAKAIDTWAKSASTNVGLSRAAALEAASGFGNMFTQLGFTGGAAADLSTKTVQMAADLGSFNNLPTADVADKISAAFRGEYDSLQSLIPNINAARVEQEAMAATGKANAAELTAQEKAAAVLAIVQKDGAAAMGDFAKTSDGLANSQKTLTAQWDDAKASLGQMLVGPAAGLTRFLNEAIPKVREFGGWFKENLGTIAGFAIALGALVLVVQAHNLALAIGAAGGIAQWIAQTRVASAVSKAWAAVQWLLNAAMSANPLGLVVIAIAALVGALIYAWNNSETFRNIVIGVFNAIKSAVAAVVSFFINQWNGAVAFIRGVPGAITGFFSGIGQWFSNLWSGIKNGVVNGWNAVVGYVRGVPGMIMSAIGNLGGILVSAGGDLLRGLWNGISGLAGWLRSKILGFFGSLVPGWVKDVFGIRSPSKVFAQFGKYLTQGLAVGIGDSSAMRQVQRATQNLSTSVTGAFDSPQLAVAAGGGSRGNNYTINMSVPPTADRAAIGMELKRAIAEAERVNGR